MSDAIRVLQVYPQMNNAGTERVIMNLYNNLDRREVQFDFLCERPGEMDESLAQLGARFFYIYDENKGQYYKKLLQFFANHPEFHIVHTHTHARMDVVLKAAKEAGIQCRIAHSHNARNDLPRIAWIIKGLTSIPIESNANYFFACSHNAARWLFPNRIKTCEVLFNGINLNTYLYNSLSRKNKRKELGIEENVFTMVHVGRFAKQKNHKYLIDIAKEYNAAHKDWRLLLVGEGPLEDEIREIVCEYGLKEHVSFLGARNDVNELLSASDLFIFPSLHEGLGIVVIEAQASALPCVVSDAVPEEADLGINLMKRISLKNLTSNWVRVIDNMRTATKDRNQYKEEILESKYNISTISERIQKFYISHC